MERLQRTTVTIAGTLVLFAQVKDYVIGNSIMEDHYVLENGEYVLTTDKRYMANKTYFTKEIPDASKYEIWVAYSEAGKNAWYTLGTMDFYDVEPENFSSSVDEYGNFSFTAQEFKVGYDYRIKLRSSEYKNIDVYVKCFTETFNFSSPIETFIRIIILFIIKLFI